MKNIIILLICCYTSSVFGQQINVVSNNWYKDDSSIVQKVDSLRIIQRLENYRFSKLRLTEVFILRKVLINIDEKIISKTDKQALKSVIVFTDAFSNNLSTQNTLDVTISKSSAATFISFFSNYNESEFKRRIDELKIYESNLLISQRLVAQIKLLEERVIDKIVLIR